MLHPVTWFLAVLSKGVNNRFVSTFHQSIQLRMISRDNSPLNSIVLKWILHKIQVFSSAIHHDSQWTTMMTDNIFVDELGHFLRVGRIDSSSFHPSTEIVL